MFKEKDILVKGMEICKKYIFHDHIRGLQYEDVSIKTSDGIRLHGLKKFFNKK